MNTKFSEELQKLCQDLGISQMVLAGIIKKTQKGISDRFKDDRFTSDEVFAIMDAFNCTLEIVIDNDTIITDNESLYKFLDSDIVRGKHKNNEIAAMMGLTMQTYSSRIKSRNLKFSYIVEALSDMGYSIRFDIDSSNILSREEMYSIFYKSLLSEEARERKNARQREYAKKTGYTSQSKKKYEDEKTRMYTIKVMINTESEIIEKIEQQTNELYPEKWTRRRV